MSEKHPIRFTPEAVYADGEALPSPGSVPVWGTEGAAWSLDGTGTGGGDWIYGDGSDGDLVLNDGGTWVPGFYHDVTIAEGATVALSSAAFVWPIYKMTGTFTILGTLSFTGSDAVDRNAGASTLAIGVGAGGSQDVGIVQATQLTVGAATLLDAVGTPMGGAGGDGANGNGGTKPQPVYPVHLGPKSALGLTSAIMINGPVGGSSGGGDGTNYGGAGGGGGAWAVICAKHIVHGPDNQYNLQGGNGAPGGDDGTGSVGHGNCGGGGGGAAGYWITISDDITGDANIVGTGGAGGVHSGTGGAYVLGQANPAPLTVVASVNDEFVYTPAGGSPETFTMVPGTYGTVAAVAAAVRAAVGSSAEAFSTLANVTVDGSALVLTTVAIGGAADGATISFGAHDVANNLGFPDNPDTFGAGADSLSDGQPGDDGFVIHLLNS